MENNTETPLLDEVTIAAINIQANAVIKVIKSHPLQELRRECENSGFTFDKIDLFVINSLEYLDGIDVNTYLEILFDEDEDTYNFSLRIQDKTFHRHLFEEQIESNIEITKELVVSVYKKIIEKFERLKYCKIRNVFKETEYLILCGGKYINPNKVNECSVCHEKTGSKTKCEHFLCLCCAIQIKNNTCPLCRENIVLL